MAKCRFTGDNGSFVLKDAGKYSGLYFPLAGERGLKSAVTPELRGDAKLDQNHFLLSPVSACDLQLSHSGRNFWCVIPGKGLWSATGCSAQQQADRHTDREDETELEAGYMWQTVRRTSKTFGLRAEILSFDTVEENAEIHQVTLCNVSDAPITLTPVAAIPIYGRSADNLRDHRHVTSLLHRIQVTEYGVSVCPTLSFDERGHQKNDTVYTVEGMDEYGNAPESFYPEVDEFVGEGGNLEWPDALLLDRPGVGAGTEVNGQEALGGLRFAPVTLQPGQSRAYTLILSVTGIGRRFDRERFTGRQAVDAELEQVKAHWLNKVNVYCHTGDADFDRFMRWIAFQPELRRLFGCSFLPHHDYGKGGRGWRDLWQDCLALLLMDPSGVRRMLLDNFAGVRVDGTNATIIGEKQGEFKADRNAITRVWMDHGVWPLMTTKLYIDQTGDLGLLDEEIRYFKDRQVVRGTAVDQKWQPGQLWQKDGDGNEYHGTVLEHLLVQNLTAFWEVGEHNHIRLRDADWNDAMDLGGHRGESVAFTNAYAKNLLDLADLVEQRARRGQKSISILEEMTALLAGDSDVYEQVEEKTAHLNAYLDTCIHAVSGRRVDVDAQTVAASLREKGEWLQEHIRRTEWVSDSKGNGWYNGYYDDNGRALEGELDGESRVILTGQVFAVMSGTATQQQVGQIAKTADAYLYDPDCGGYRLNTDYHEVKMDMGRMFGFAYGEKENGGVFCHMSTMFGNALYQRGFAREGFKSLHTLYRQSMNFERSRIYPGIPEYFGKGGRGLYHYLTGAASWYLLTVVNQVFGVRGELGDLVVEPKLVAEQFDAQGSASIELNFAGRRWKVVLDNPSGADYGSYRVTSATVDGTPVERIEKNRATVDSAVIEKLDRESTHVIRVTLG